MGNCLGILCYVHYWDFMGLAAVYTFYTRAGVVMGYVCALPGFLFLRCRFLHGCSVRLQQHGQSVRVLQCYRRRFQHIQQPGMTSRCCCGINTNLTLQLGSGAGVCQGWGVIQGSEWRVPWYSAAAVFVREVQYTF